MMRTVLAVWVAAFALAVALMLLLPPAKLPLLVEALERDGAADVFIGTSLIGFAVPPKGVGALGGTEHHVRLYVSSLSERSALDLAEMALASRATRTIILEAYPFVRDFRYEVRGAKALGLLERGADRVILTAQTLSTSTRMFLQQRLQGRDPLAPFLAERPIDRPYSLKAATLENLYPIHVRTPREEARLVALVRQATARGVEVILVAPPRSEAAVRLNGRARTASLQRAIQDLAIRLDVPVFAPVGPWPDSLFTDQAHLNRAGRERFLSALRQFGRTAHDG